MKEKKTKKQTTYSEIQPRREYNEKKIENELHNLK